MTRAELLDHFAKIAKREGFIMTKHHVVGITGEAFSIDRPGPAKKRALFPDESSNWDSWRKVDR